MMLLVGGGASDLIRQRPKRGFAAPWAEPFTSIRAMVASRPAARIILLIVYAPFGASFGAPFGPRRSARDALVVVLRAHSFEQRDRLRVRLRPLDRTVRHVHGGLADPV